MIEKLTNLILWLKWKLNLKLNVNLKKPVALNLGCGLEVHNNWFNIDGSFNAFLSRFPIFIIRIAYRFSGSRNHYTEDEYIKILKNNKFFQYNLKYGIPVKSNSVDFIFSCHFIEHLSKNDAKFLMHECYRVLKKGGVIRTVIPDLDHAITLMNNGEKSKALNDYFFIEEGEITDFSRHKYMYDFDLFKKLLNSYTFTNVTKYEFQNGKVPNIDILDNRSDDSIYIEATK